VPTGVRVACDVGSVRVGLARSDASGVLAVPLPAVPAGDGAIDAVAAVLHEWEATAVYVGLPLRLAGDEGPAAVAARTWATRLAERAAVPVRLIDERLSTVQAQRGLHAAGRSTRTSRDVIDSASAVTVLQSVLDREQRTGEPAGELVAIEGGTIEGGTP
jgi:putative Holliday junction resolvase